MPGTVIPEATWFVGVTSPYYNSDCDQTTDWSGTPTADAEAYIQKTTGTSYGSLSKKISATTGSHLFSLKTATNLSDSIIYAWVNGSSITQFDTKANGGIRIRVEDASANWGEWWVSGKDTYKGGWECISVRTNQPWNSSGSTPPASGSITKVGVTFATIKTATKVNCWWDALRYGKGIIVKSGSSGDPATFDDLVTWEENEVNRTGILSKKEGIIFLQGCLTVGGSGSGETTYFKDTNEVIVFQDKAFGTFYNIIFTGSATGTTEVYFGDKSGIAGISGITFRSVGASKYKLTADNPNITKIGIYGCNFFDADTISLPISGSDKEVLSCSIQASNKVSGSTCVMKYNKFISSDNQAIRPLTGSSVTSTGSYYLTDSEFISCPKAIEIATTGVYNFDTLTFTNNTVDVDNTSGGTVKVICRYGSNADQAKVSGDTTIINQKTLTIDGLIAGSEVVILEAGTTNVLVDEDSSGTSYAYGYNYAANTYVDIVVHSLGYEYMVILNHLLPNSDSSIPVSQRIDRNYYNP